MNVLFIDQYSALGGAQQCLLDLMPAIEERGWTARAALPPRGPLVGLLRDRGIPVSELRSGPYRSGKKSAGDLFRFAADIPMQRAAIDRLLDESPTDLLYVNGPRLLIAAAMAARKRIPILFHAHHVIGQKAAAYLEGRALRRSCATVAACCDAVAAPLRSWVASGPIHTIPNGTADFGFRERAFDPGREVRIGIIGRIAREKGQVEFLRAAAALMDRVPHARFVICGAPLFGDREYYNEVLKLAAGLPVEFLDWQDDVAGVMRGLDVLVIASTQEGMPRVLLEAFSAGLPVVAFPVGGIPEVIEHGVTGFLTTDLAKTLAELLQSDLRSVAHNARQQWEQRYTLAVYRERITNLMELCVPRAGQEKESRSTHKSATPR